MKLLSITVGGFRNIRRTTLQMQELMALISCNSYGKSNVITAIEFGLDFIHNARETRQDMMGYVPYIPLNKETAKLDYNIVFEFLDNVHGTDMIGLYEIGFVWKKGDKTGRRITIESLKVKEDRPKQKFMQLIKRDEQNALYKASQEGRCSSKIKVFADELVVDKILNHDEWTYMELLEGLCSLRIYVDRHLDASALYRPDPFIRKGEEYFDLDSTNLPRTIYHLQKEYPEKFNLLMDAYHQLFPQFIKIDVREFKLNMEESQEVPDELPFKLSESIYRLFVQDVHLNQPIDFKLLSDGAKRIFHVLLTVILSDIQPVSVLALEEPENSIHPALFGSYIQIISQLVADDVCVILTSHSPYLLQYMPLQSIHIGLPRTDATAFFVRVAEAETARLQTDVATSEMNLGEYIFDLMSGDEEDHAFLETYLEMERHG